MPGATVLARSWNENLAEGLAQCPAHRGSWARRGWRASNHRNRLLPCSFTTRTPLNWNRRWAFTSWVRAEGGKTLNLGFWECEWELNGFRRENSLLLLITEVRHAWFRGLGKWLQCAFLIAILPLKVADSHHFGVLNCLNQVLETVEHLFEMTRKINLF